MAVLVVLETLVAVGGVSSAASRAPLSADPLVRAIERVAGAGVATLTGSARPVSDPLGDQAGGKWREADLTGGEYAAVSTVPRWVLDGVFGCQDYEVACSVGSQGPGAFDDGALIAVLQMAASPEGLAADSVGEWGLLFDVPGRAAAPAGDASYALASTVFVTSLTTSGLEIHLLNWRGGSFLDAPTAARSRWVGDTLLMLLPIRVELGAMPVAWDGLASVSGAGAAAFVITRDWLRGGETTLLPFDPAPTLVFQSAAPAGFR